MSSEIEVPETPNWLQELEAKREKRLKPRLGHEAGAGAPCLKCGDKCPGLDLHFWRKCCKICKCAKEEHEVQDDDIYGWAQFQLLGSKPNKIKRKIVLPGKKDEVELDWAPKGHNDTVDKYLKTLPPDQLPVKGSQAAQDRKQLLQKQIPIHDIDPTLCHELTEQELKQMNDYIAHVKQTSVGVGQIVSLSSIIKGNLHMFNPSEAAIIASRYAKGVPLSEIVKLQAQNRAGSLKPQGLNQTMGKLSLNDPRNKNLPSLSPNSVVPTEQTLHPLVSNKVHDINYPGYSNDINQALPNAQFSSGLRPGQFKGFTRGNHPGQDQSGFDQSINEKYLQNPNFDPKNIPSQFINHNTPYGQVYSGQDGQQNVPYDENILGSNQGNSAFVPYNKVSSGFKPEENYIEENSPSGAGNYTSSLPGRGKNGPGGFRPGDNSNISGGSQHNYTEDVNSQSPNYSRNLTKHTAGNNNFETLPADQFPHRNMPNSPFKNTSTGLKPGQNAGQNFANQSSDISSAGNGSHYENVADMKGRDASLPNYAPSKYSLYSDIQSPARVPKNVRDLAFSTYDPSNVNPSELENINSPKYHTGLQEQSGMPVDNYSGESGPANTKAIGKNYNPSGGHFDQQNTPYDQNSSRPGLGQYGVPNENYPGGFTPENVGVIGNNHLGQKTFGKNIPSDQFGRENVPFDSNSSTTNPSNKSMGYRNFDQQNPPYDQNSSYPGQYGVPDENHPSGFAPENSRIIGSGKAFGKNVPSGQFTHENVPYDPNSSGLYGPQGSNHPTDGSTSGDVHNQITPAGKNYDPNILVGQYGTPNLAYENYPSAINPADDSMSGQNYPGGQFSHENVPYGNKPHKKLSELHPGKIDVNEDFLHPSQVTIGAIQDINYPEIKAATHGTNDFYEDYSPDSLREILNNIKLPDCHYCKKPFEENEFAIMIDRANVLFHAECFKCAGCNQILADNVYFYNKETDNIYCCRDYAKIRGFPRCKACDELIFTKEYCLAENSTFHLKHFCCIECDKPLAGQDYTLEDEMPYCLPCFEQSKASKCNSCCRVIKPDEIGCNLNGVHFHAVDECFACKICKKPLMGKKLLLRNQKLYCSHDCFGADK